MLRLVDDWKQAWRWFSTHAMIAAMAVNEFWAEMPNEYARYFTGTLSHRVVAALLFLGLAGRLVKQRKPKQGDDA